MLNLDHHIDLFLNFLTVERHLADNTLQAYGRDLRFFAEYLQKQRKIDLAQVVETDVLGFIAALRARGVKSRSTARALVTVRSLFNFLVGERLIEEDPTGRIEFPKLGTRLPKVLNLGQIDALLSQPNLKQAIGVRDFAMLQLMYATGMRISELVNLHLNSLNLEAGYLRVMGKGSKERVVPMGSVALAALNEYIKRVREPQVAVRDNEYLFVGQKRARLTRQAFWNRIKVTHSSSSNSPEKSITV